MLNIYPWQGGQWEHLQAALRQDRVAHAMLFAGARGTGLDRFSTVLAARLLCGEPSAEGMACGQCRSCILFAAGNHPDIRQLEPEEKGKQIKVEAVREIIEFVQLSSQYGRYKVVIIEPAEAMNRSAANSLLKILEEPPATSIFILNTWQPARLPVTIRSRCQRINFPPATGAGSRQWLMEQLECPSATAEQLLAAAQGEPLTALALHGSGRLEQQAQVLEDMQALRRAGGDPVSIAKKWTEYGTADVLLWLLTFLHGMSRGKLGVGTATTGAARDLQELAKGLDLAQLVECYNVILGNYRAATGTINLNQQGLLEEVIVYWQQLATSK